VPAPRQASRQAPPSSATSTLRIHPIRPWVHIPWLTHCGCRHCCLDSCLLYNLPSLSQCLWPTPSTAHTTHPSPSFPDHAGMQEGHYKQDVFGAGHFWPQEEESRRPRL
jgi:hypothetical protein